MNKLPVALKPLAPDKRRLKSLLMAAGVVLLLAVFVFGWMWAYARIAYKDKVYPGVRVGSYHLGGLDGEGLKGLVENFNNRLAKEGISFTFINAEGQSVRFQVSVLSGEEDANEMARIDSERLLAEALAVGREGGYWERLWKPWYYRWRGERLSAPVVLDESGMADALRTYLVIFEDKGRNANIKIRDVATLEHEIAPEKPGTFFPYDKIVAQTRQVLSKLSLEPIRVEQEFFRPSIKKADVQGLTARLPRLFSYGDISLVYINPQSQARTTWIIRPDDYANWLEIRKANNHLIFALQSEAVKRYLNMIRYDINRPAQDAKFIMMEGRVKEFQSNRPGISLDIDRVYADLDQVFQERNYHPEKVVKAVILSVKIIEPKVKLSDVNSLGITNVIGAGTSTFRDSHTNRIKNIANAVKRLNGTLIKPGEEFSAVKYAGPFTAENGFLPEEVIKGRQIKKEIGGGMCQIGTTLFRMAMNSGLPITERRNHSLVVHYYADPVNGNPGTDATVYEPLVDFKFLNDTGNYLLLQTEIDFAGQMLTFTLWGQPDGRRGWYSHPTVSRWIGSGAPQEIITTKLNPGEKRCQNAFRGAVASFTYTRVTPAGEQIDRLFESYYRPLPKICMVGVGAIPAGCKEGESCVQKSADEQPPEEGAEEEALEAELDEAG